tara:strand:+ start:1848 stop:2054 length:207 start_codon:yes stop_codon:yes gene_type:complete
MIARRQGTATLNLNAGVRTYYEMVASKCRAISDFRALMRMDELSPGLKEQVEATPETECCSEQDKLSQ